MNPFLLHACTRGTEPTIGTLQQLSCYDLDTLTCHESRTMVDSWTGAVTFLLHVCTRGMEPTIGTLEALPCPDIDTLTLHVSGTIIDSWTG